MYKNTLEAAIESEFSGNFKKLLIGLLQANRSAWSTEVDVAKMRKDAELL